MTTGIYMIKNLDNGSVYVGSSKNIEVRWQKHKAELTRNGHRNPHLQNAWNKYGEEVFAFAILETTSQADRYEAEQWYLDSFKLEYNICRKARGGNGNDGAMKGFKHSEESKRRMADSKRGTKKTEETRQKMSEKLLGNQRSLGHVHTDEAKAKMREAWARKRNAQRIV